MIGGSGNFPEGFGSIHTGFGSGRFWKTPDIRQQQRVLNAAGDCAEQLWEKLLESAGAGAGAAGEGQKVLDSAGVLGCAAE